MSWGASGFAHAPVTRAALFTAAAASVFATAGRSGATAPALQLGVAAGRQPLWRLLTSNVAFTSTGEIVLGLGLLYAFRIFERQRGSAKFASFALTALSLSTALQLATAAAASAAGLLPRGACLASGPYGLVFALGALFARDVPVTARFSLARVLPLTDKVFCYAAAAQLALGGGVRTLLPALCGAAAGAVVATDEAGFASARGTQAVLALCTRAVALLSPAAGAPPPAPPPRRAAATTAAAAAAARPAAAPRAAPRAAPPPPRAEPPPSEEAIESLVQMGFNRRDAVAALQQGGGDIALAAELLLAGSS